MLNPLFGVSQSLIWLFWFLFAPSALAGQSWREQPQNVSFILGQTATLKCRVDNVKGRVQWAKGGFVLGYDRSIPGFPRYEMIGSEILGEFDLMITDVQLSDDDMYECQVGPSGGDPALAGDGYLTVLLPPDPPTIEGYVKGGVVKVPYDQSSLDLTCISNNGKPAGTIRWFRNDVEIADGIVTAITPKADKRQDERSVLTIKPKNDDDRAVFKCQVEGAALQIPQMTFVNMSVMHPPEPPTLTGYSNGQVVKTGDTLKLVCVSRGGNPLPQVHWLKNGVGIDYSFITTGDVVENEFLFTVQPNDMNAIYKCEVSNQVTTTPLAAQVTLTVQFAPSKVTMTGFEKAKAGDSIDLKCESSISNPPAQITWFSQGLQLQGSTDTVTESPKGGFTTASVLKIQLSDRDNGVTYQCYATNPNLGDPAVATVTIQVMYPPNPPTISGYSTGSPVTSGEKQTLTCTAVGGNPLAALSWYKGDKKLESQSTVAGSIVSSQIAFILEPADNGASYSCWAQNDATATPLKTSVQLKVNFRPKTLNITTQPPQIKAGQAVTISCQTSSANPQSTIIWLKDGEEIHGVADGVLDAEFGGKSTRSKLLLTPTANDNGEIYSCRAYNAEIDSTITDAVTLDVLFPPIWPSDVPVDLTLTEKSSKVLNFTAKSNPPVTEYQWFKGDVKIKFPAPKRDVSIPRFKATDGVLNINEISRDDSGNYKVKAVNAEGMVEQAFSINVQFGAEIKDITNEVTVQKGVTVSISCTVDANPFTDATIAWSREGYDMSRTSVALDGKKSTLTIAEASREDSGEFICTASNGIGQAVTKKATILVKFAPEIDKSPALSKAAADKGSTATLVCLASGVPDVTFKWKKSDADVTTVGNSRYKIESRGAAVTQFRSELSIYNTSQSDYGTYVCVATNELGQDSNDIVLDGTTRPYQPENVTFINATHNSITLTWIPGFDGGSEQTFQVQYAELDSDGNAGGFTYKDVVPGKATVFRVSDLKLGTRYKLSVRGLNRLGEGDFSAQPLIARTSSVPPTGGVRRGDDTSLIIILTVSIVGMVLLGLNVLLILFFIRRRKKRLEKEASEGTSQSNTVEMFNAPTITEDSKSYTSYGGRSLDDFKDDPYAHYYQSHDDDEMHRFLAPGTLPTSFSDGPHYATTGRPRSLGPSPYPHGSEPYVDFQTLPGQRSGQAIPNNNLQKLHVAAGSRGGIVLDDQTALASGLGPIEPQKYGTLSRNPGASRKGQAPPPPVANGSAQPSKPARYPPPPPTRTATGRHESQSPNGVQPPLPTRNYSADEVPVYAPGSTHSSLSHASSQRPLYTKTNPDIEGALV